ncbi:hypothetical protein F2Q69_00006009 [Brassica cretica]|uniref:Uncharacterized protein n=1 Tax=Brassica cretica TaxID=69181 RepID=A0A8S9PKH7_BRACR|nr:hypothetical protein F2Q69_00006009 [Brassica cretica]
MAPDACAATPRAPHVFQHSQDTCRTPPLLPDVRLYDWNSCTATHHLTHVDQHASVACAETPRAWLIHLVLLHVRLHVLLPCTATTRASVYTQLDRWLTPRSEPMQRATSSFSIHSPDCGPSGNFLIRDEPQIFFCSRSYEFNIFNKLQSEDLGGKYFPILRDVPLGSAPGKTDMHGLIMGSKKDICSMFETYLPNLDASTLEITSRMFSTQLQNSSNKNQIKWVSDERVMQFTKPVIFSSYEFGPYG